jgi:hypothetical protein
LVSTLSNKKLFFDPKNFKEDQIAYHDGLLVVIILFEVVIFQCCSRALILTFGLDDKLG